MSEYSLGTIHGANYSFLPITRPKLLKFYETQRDVFWVPQEIKYSSDRSDFLKLDAGTQEFIKFVLAFFAQADGIINENLIDSFQKDTRRYKEAGYFYIIQAAIELIHNETYSLLINAIITDADERNKVLDGVHNYPEVGAIADWMFKWMSLRKGPFEDLTNLRERIVAFACIEGVVFSSAFAAVYWLKKKNVLPGLCKANEFIARDERIHTLFAVELYHELVRELPPLSNKRIAEIISSAVDLTETFTRSALKVDLIGMNADEMIKYVKCTANGLYSLFTNTLTKLYDVTNPFLWMITIGLSNKTNFFESTVTEYAKEEAGDDEFDTDAAF